MGGKLLALKPDVTLSIIKNGEDRPGEKQKVCYNENVYRISDRTRQYKEIMQAGLECIGDIDLYDIYAEVVLGGYVEAKYVHPYYCMFYGRQDIKNYVMSNEEFLTKYGINVVMYKKMEGVFRQMGDDCFVVRTPNRDMLFEMMEKLSAQY